MYRQYRMTCGRRVTTGWIDTDAPLKCGTRLTLKEYPREFIWTITEAGHLKREDKPERRWTVAGLW